MPKERLEFHMRNIKMIMMYDGSGYAGWQKLGVTDKKPALQTVLEDCLSVYLQEDIKIIGSGRTDAGTHALGQVANFHCQCQLSVEEMMKELNLMLPVDIAVFHMEEIQKDFHSRYSAKTKTYEYRIDQGETQSVFTRKYTYHYPKTLNIKNMEAASEYLIGTHDFKSFSTDRKDNKSTVRTLESIEINTINNELRIRITGDGFLYNMVRIIVGTLLEIGEGIKKTSEIRLILETRDRQLAGPTVSSQGLFLYEVKY